MNGQEREALKRVEGMASDCGGLSWSQAIDRLIAIRKEVHAALAARGDTERPDGAGLIAAERNRQRGKWGDRHDSTHDMGELLDAAILYATPPDRRRRIDGVLDRRQWPWNWASFKPRVNDRVRELTKAGALVAAEIDRLLRDTEQSPNEEIG
jgi:hypothetical protein